MSTPTSFLCSTNEERWLALSMRDPRADGDFYYGVKTTGFFSRPTCPARRPKRKNVSFFETISAAAHAGYRECKRCNPGFMSLRTEHSSMILRACRLLQE